MMETLAALTVYGYFGILLILSIYGLHRYFILFLYFKHYKFRPREQAPAMRPDEYPSVTVQLPIYNEYYVLQLHAKHQGLTYHRILYWVNSKNFRPQKAEFYSISGRLLKTCYYKNFQLLGGGMRPTRLLVVDALHSGQSSTLEYHDMVRRNLPDKFFNKDYLKKLTR